MGQAKEQPGSRAQSWASQISAGLGAAQVPEEEGELGSPSLPSAKHHPLQEPCLVGASPSAKSTPLLLLSTIG